MDNVRISPAKRHFLYLFLIMEVGFTASLIPGCAPTLKTPTISKEAGRKEAEKQRELAFKVFVRRQDRLMDISWPLLAAGAELCKKDVNNTYGFTIHDLNSYGNDFRKIADRYFDLKDAIKVRYVNPRLPAAKEGLQSGDRILSVNGISTSKMDAAAVWDEIKKSPPHKLTLVVERSGEKKELAITIKGVNTCRYNVKLVVNDAVNAFADGKNVSITTGMLRFTENNEELALVISHEIAHNALGHITKKKGNVLMGSIVDILIYNTTGVDTQGVFGKIGAQAFSQAFESEADYEGLYIAARAGFDIKDAPFFWRRMAVEHPSSIKENFSATHPSTPRRFLVLKDTIKEIEEKRKKGKPLLPEKKSSRWFNREE